MAAIHDYPLIAITEVFDLPSVDNPDGGDLRPTEEILDRKLRDVDYGYGWTPDMEFNRPIHIVEFGPGGYAYGHRLGEEYYGRRLMGNGHHRLAYQALVQGALFVAYTNDDSAANW
jgi:hypothetical protein